MQNEIYILYGSQTGNAEEISKEIYQLLVEKGFNCKHGSLNSTLTNNGFSFVKETVPCKLIVVCSTTGNGDAPESANHFWRKIKNRALPKHLFDGIQFAVLGLGDTNYDKFCQMGKGLDRRFEELGGTRIIDLHCADEATGLEETVNEFIDKVRGNPWFPL
jgi:sulfite reductase alpha subunit-like flavoprotein